jgi:chromosome segregation ATPase
MTRCIFRWGLLGGLALGGLTLLVGPQRVAAGLSQVRASLQGVVDSCVDDPVALRRQLQSLGEQYPGRIAEVRAELTKVDSQLNQFQRDTEISQRVIAMTGEDLASLKSLVARAETERATSARPVAIRHEGVRFDIDEAYAEAARINKVRQSYQDRLASNTQQLTVLGEQKQRLSEILGKLETEFGSFQTQMWQLDRQIDAIERNARLIEMTEELQATLDSYDQWGEVGNLKQLESKLAELRTQQEAQLKYLKSAGLRHNYHDRAATELNMQDCPENPFEGVFEGIEDQPAEETIITEPASNRTSDSFACLDEPLVIQ